MKIIIINGPNLNLLGTRQPDVYGTTPFDTYLATLRHRHPDAEIDYYQSNHEGDLVDKIHSAGFTLDGIILNAGAYTHTSIALADAISAIPAPVIEVHLTNTSARETFRHHSYLTPVCAGLISGFGLASYELALIALKTR